MFKYFVKLTFIAAMSLHSKALIAADEPHSVAPSLSHIKLNLVFDDESNGKSLQWLQDKYSNLMSLEKVEAVASLPNQASFRDKCPEVYNQGNLGSCTANAIAGAMEYVRMMLQLEDQYTPSREFIYFNEREMEGTIEEDSGATLSDGIRSICQFGACHESLWPYSDDGVQFKKRPTEACYQDALTNVDLDTLALARLYQDEHTLKSVIASNIPVVYGVRVYKSFMTEEVKKTGAIPMPNAHAEKLMGGHAIMLVGYDDNTRTFTFRNSWGREWGDGGYGTMPYDYVLNNKLASDFWRITKVGPKPAATNTGSTGSYGCILF